MQASFDKIGRLDSTQQSTNAFAHAVCYSIQRGEGGGGRGGGGGEGGGGGRGGGEGEGEGRYRMEGGLLKCCSYSALAAAIITVVVDNSSLVPRLHSQLFSHRADVPRKAGEWSIYKQEVESN